MGREKEYEVRGREKANRNPEAQTGVHDKLKPVLRAHHPRVSKLMRKCSFMTKLNTHLAQESEQVEGDVVRAGAGTRPLVPQANQVSQ